MKEKILPIVFAVAVFLALSGFLALLYQDTQRAEQCTCDMVKNKECKRP